jgi:hypothetical protein
VLTKILCQINAGDIVIFPAELSDARKSVIRGTVIHQHHFIRIILQFFHCFSDFLYHTGQRRLGAVTGNHEADHFFHAKASCPL